MTTESSEPLITSRSTTATLPSVNALKSQLPLDEQLVRRVEEQREAVRAILDGRDQRMLVVVGPCSLHDRASAIEYAERLAALSRELDDQLLLVMRAYIEKPRTTVGWKGLLYDPFLDGSDDMASGLEVCRSLLIELLQRGVPLATELLNPMAAGYFADLMAWGAIGARTTESQVHRELVSGLPFPVGFKNGTSGSFKVACDAMGAAAGSHHYFGMSDEGTPSMLASTGNAHTHLVLRGGADGPNHDAASIQAATETLKGAGYRANMMVDCSHGNSGKNPALQPVVLGDVVTQRVEGSSGLVSVMIESHLNEGKQPLSASLEYGVSITDGCLGWTQTEEVLRDAATRLAHA